MNYKNTAIVVMAQTGAQIESVVKQVAESKPDTLEAVSILRASGKVGVPSVEFDNVIHAEKVPVVAAFSPDSFARAKQTMESKGLSVFSCVVDVDPELAFCQALTSVRENKYGAHMPGREISETDFLLQYEAGDIFAIDSLVDPEEAPTPAHYHARLLNQRMREEMTWDMLINPDVKVAYNAEDPALSASEMVAAFSQKHIENGSFDMTAEADSKPAPFEHKGP